MRRSVEVLLTDAIEAGESIGAIVSGRTIEEYCATRMLRSAVERELLIIGEALNAADSASSETRGRVSALGRIIGLRNRLAHAYDAVDDQMLWSIATRDIPVLCDELRAWLADFG
jgi:uncharacterized protein with HEPN domain